MKFMYGNVPVKSLNIKYFEQDTNDCDMIASDLQTGKTAVARGRKITGTGKSFEFASYGKLRTNTPTPIPNSINVIHISSLDYPVQLSVALTDMKNLDFTSAKTIGNITINGTTSPITVSVINNMLKVNCSNTIYLQVFYGKDNYV